MSALRKFAVGLAAQILRGVALTLAAGAWPMVRAAYWLSRTAELWCADALGRPVWPPRERIRWTDSGWWGGKKKK